MEPGSGLTYSSLYLNEGGWSKWADFQSLMAASLECLVMVFSVLLSLVFHSAKTWRLGPVMIKSAIAVKGNFS